MKGATIGGGDLGDKDIKDDEISEKDTKKQEKMVLAPQNSDLAEK